MEILLKRRTYCLLLKEIKFHNMKRKQREPSFPGFLFCFGWGALSPDGSSERAIGSWLFLIDLRTHLTRASLLLYLLGTETF